MDYEPNATFVTMTEEYMDNLDYQTQSSWYKAVKETGKFFFTTPQYLIGGMQEISKGNFAVDWKSRPKMRTLANAVNTMAGDLIS